MKNTTPDNKLKGALHLRGDMLYCPLSLCLDSYSNCAIDCVYCFCRRLNEVWDKELRPMDIEVFDRTLHNGLKNKDPKSSLSWAIKNRKTIKFGNKSEPFQKVEEKYEVTFQALQILKKHKWPVVIETKETGRLLNYLDLIQEMKDHIWVLGNVSPGYIQDWKIFEKEIPPSPNQRLLDLCKLRQNGINVGVTGEPFIPGLHTEKDFEFVVRRIKKYGLKSYNIYNLHFNSFVAKRLHSVGIDIEKIWEYNNDSNWKPILNKLIDICKKYDIILGCPDFVNSGWKNVQETNTCCGVGVPTPCTFNAITWKREIQICNREKEQILKDTWDGVGDFEKGKEVMMGTSKELYNITDIGD